MAVKILWHFIALAVLLNTGLFTSLSLAEEVPVPTSITVTAIQQANAAVAEAAALTAGVAAFNECRLPDPQPYYCTELQCESECMQRAGVCDRQCDQSFSSCIQMCSDEDVECRGRCAEQFGCCGVACWDDLWRCLSPCGCQF